MQGLFIGLGNAADEATAEPPGRRRRSGGRTCSWRPFPEVRILLSHSLDDVQGELAWSPDGRVGVLFQGYVHLDGAAPEDAAPRLAETVARHGLDAALDSISAGSYNLVALDRERRRCTVVTDALATIPLYRAAGRGGWLLATSPVALVRGGIASTTVDPAACAMYVALGHLVGERHFLEEIRTCRPATAYTWDDSRRALDEHPTGRDPFGLRPDPGAAAVAELARRFRASCQRHARLGLEMAHLQSGGMDSRLVLSAWPSDEPPPCYAYGDPDSTEVAVAREVAERAGAPFVHEHPHGDEIAEHLETNFAASGLIVYPERHAMARRLADDGRTGVLDGLVGDVYLGGTYYRGDRASSAWPRLARHALRYVDRRVGDVGYDRVVEAVMRQSALQGRFSTVLRLARDDVAERWRAAVDDVKGAMVEEMRRYADPEDSLAFLWRDYLVATRGLHEIAQQGVIMRPYLQVCLPFVGDRSFLDLAARVPAEHSAFRRLYLRLYRREFPGLAGVPYAASMLPLRASAFRHRVSSALLSRGLEVPGLSGRTGGRPRSATSHCWGAWLRESPRLRERLGAWIREGSLFDEAKLRARLDAIGAGSRTGTGMLSQLAAVSRWRAIGS